MEPATEPGCQNCEISGTAGVWTYLGDEPVYCHCRAGRELASRHDLRTILTNKKETYETTDTVKHRLAKKTQ